MVRALPGNPRLSTDILESMRPGLVLSVALHIGLLMALAYALAFHSQLPPVPISEDPPLVYRELPPTIQPKPQKQPVIFHPIDAPQIAEIHTSVGTLVLPAEPDFRRAPADEVTAAEPPAQPVIVNPRPIFRGSLAFPPKAENAGISGYVDFSFLIEPDGTVGYPEVIAETPTGYGFAAAALKAFATWRFEPKLINGKAVAAPAQIRVSFKLR